MDTIDKVLAEALEGGRRRRAAPRACADRAGRGRRPLRAGASALLDSSPRPSGDAERPRRHHLYRDGTVPDVLLMARLLR